MRGLVYKDICMSTYGLGISIILGAIFSICLSNWLPAVLMPVLFAAILHGVSVNDGKRHWERFAVSTGIPRRTLIDSRFVSGMTLVALGTLIGSAMNVAIGASVGEPMGLDYLWISIIGFLLGMIAVSTSIAVDFSLGHTRYGQYLLPISMGAILMITIVMVMDLNEIIGIDGIQYITAIVLAVTVVIAIVLRAVALKTFGRRDL